MKRAQQSSLKKFTMKLGKKLCHKNTITQNCTMHTEAKKNATFNVPQNTNTIIMCMDDLMFFHPFFIFFIVVVLNGVEAEA